jgi:hypothetical protein
VGPEFEFPHLGFDLNACSNNTDALNQFKAYGGLDES